MKGTETAQAAFLVDKILEMQTGESTAVGGHFITREFDEKLGKEIATINGRRIEIITTAEVRKVLFPATRQ